MTQERKERPAIDPGAPSKSFDGDSSNDTTAVKPTDPRWGDVLDCVMSCAGAKTCAYRPYHCKLIVGRP